MNRIWLKNYPPGVPADINPDQYSSLLALLDESCANFADLPAYTSMGRTITYGEYEELARDFAAWLQQCAGLVKGDRIA
ncbi:MAG TPA: AMP-binding protein, partial [Steroidobacter sp.]|nr:AMP-binding protein [Steroidobacter sp.]